MIILKIIISFLVPIVLAFTIYFLLKWGDYLDRKMWIRKGVMYESEDKDMQPWSVTWNNFLEERDGKKGAGTGNSD
jgi:hypothetical protein